MSFVVNLVLGFMLLTMVFAFGLHLGLNVCVNLNVLLARSLAPLRRRQTHHQFVRLPLTDVVLGLGSVVLIGLMVASNIGTSCPPERNSGVQANVHMVQMGLEAYAADHGGRYPASFRDLAPNYLKAYPRTPWQTQQAPDSAIPASFQAPASLMEWKPLGLGRKTAPRLPTDFGAIGYTRLGPDGRYYRLSGTGKRGDQAIIVAFLTNLPSPEPTLRLRRPEADISSDRISGQVPERSRR